MKKQSLSKDTILISVVSLTLMILIIILVYSRHKDFEKTVVEQTQQQLLAIAKTTANRLEDHMTRHSEALKFLATNPQFQEEIHKRIIRKKPDDGYCFLKALYEIHKDDMDAITSTDADGIMLHRHPFIENRPGEDKADKPGVAYVIREHKPYVSEVFYNNLGNLAISISEPVFYQDEFVGLVRWMIQMDTIYEHFIGSIDAGREGCKWLIDERGFLIAHGSFDEVGEHFMTHKKKKMPGHDWSSLDKVVTKATRGDGGTGLFVCPKRGKRVIAYMPVHAGNQLWSFGLSMNYSEIEGPIIEHENNTLVLSALIILLFGAGATTFFRARKMKAELKSAEALRESEQRYRTLFEDSRDAVYVTAKEGRFVDINQSALDLFGYTREQMVGLDVRAIYVNPDDRYRFQQEIEKKGAVRDYEIKFRKKDGTEMDCLLTSTVRRSHDGTILGYQGIIRDVTEQKQLEVQLQQAQKMEAVGTLAGGIAHDFNNALQIISGYAQLLSMNKEEKDPDIRYLNQIDRSVQRATELTKQLLIFSRKVKSKLRPTDLNQEVAQVRRLLQRTIPRMIDIELDLAKDINIINADPMQLEQIMMNMGINAKDVMPEGGKLVFETKNVTLDEAYCKTHVEAVSGEYVLLAVSDTGHGMTKDTVEHIFEPFYTTKEIGKGTGLGLAMVYGIVKNHGGHIACYSEPDHGTVFKIYFPVLEEENVEQEIESVKGAEIRGGHETILLVDDEEPLLVLGQDMLREHGYTTITAESGERAIEIYKKERNRIDLVVLDVGMPGMGGYKCLRALMKIDPEIKVIIASGYTSSDEVKEALEHGAAGFIGKPYRLTDMLKSLREVLDRI
ncbi:MAG: PAS domain S-box protein [Pseudomonadota bacterium]